VNGPCRSGALRKDAPLQAAGFLAGKSLRIFWPRKETYIHLHPLFEKFPAVFFVFFFLIDNRKSLGDFFGEA
jgi:hypothetical protein